MSSYIQALKNRTVEFKDINIDHAIYTNATNTDPSITTPPAGLKLK